ncbi:MAG: hypothetical protein HC858_06590 [Brachymonas sp.]|nr:hypothetical protein [Brachymonas sp.]
MPMLLHIVAALEETLIISRNTDDKMTGAARAVVEGTLGVMGKLVSGVKSAVGVVDPVSGMLLQAAEAGAAYVGKEKPSVRLAKKFEHQDNGRSYYDIHKILKDATRPAHKQAIVGDQDHDKEFPVNFVIFIDDLDRCLPEKAVEALELIKTVFNLESFAFVLALDEEVVERGIGHRYKDYNFQGKSPKCRSRALSISKRLCICRFGYRR